MHQTRLENVIWALICGLPAAALLGGIGYLLLGVLPAALGGAAGLLLAAYCYHQGMPKPVGRALGVQTLSRRDEAVDWTQLLDYEKFYFARQLEEEERDKTAEEIYQYLIAHDFPSVEPFRRLAAIYRRRGDYRSEIDVVDRAIAHLDEQEEPGSISLKRTREEFVRRRKQAHKRLAGEGQ